MTMRQPRDLFDDFVIKLKEADAEIERLREALQGLDNLFDFGAEPESCPCFLDPRDLQNAFVEALEALRASEQEARQE